jgi:allantoicase
MGVLLPDLASRALGGGVVFVNDEFFAAGDNLVEVAAPVFDRQVFGPKGKVYDGWETRRRRDPDADADTCGRADTGGERCDQAIVRLGVPGVVRRVVIDTAFFTGNYPPYASVEGCGVDGYPAPAELGGADWTTLVPHSPLRGDARNEFAVAVPWRFTHVRLSIYPDGGVARLRVHGEPVPDPRFIRHGPVDLAAVQNGGLVVGCSDMFYGASGNLLLPGPARSMGEGWETARRRDGGNDWVQVRLGVPGVVTLVELDTTHFKGNAPAAATLHGHRASREHASREHASRDHASRDHASTDGASGDGGPWVLLPRTRLQPDTRHRFLVSEGPPVARVRLDVFPDGGLARLRLFGTAAPADLAALALRWFNLLPVDQAVAVAIHSGLDRVGAGRLADARPLTDPASLPPATLSA